MFPYRTHVRRAVAPLVWSWSWPAGEERHAEHLEGAGVRFAVSAGEGVDGFADRDVGEADLCEDRLPARTGQPAGDSTGPQVDVAHRL
jgi:hypothetical protein